MRRTDEQQAFFVKLRELDDEAGLGRVRVVADAEGFPIVPGRLGEVDWRGAEWATGEERT